MYRLVRNYVPAGTSFDHDGAGAAQSLRRSIATRQRCRRGAVVTSGGTSHVRRDLVDARESPDWDDHFG